MRLQQDHITLEGNCGAVNIFHTTIYVVVNAKSAKSAKSVKFAKFALTIELSYRICCTENGKTVKLCLFL